MPTVKENAKEKLAANGASAVPSPAVPAKAAAASSPAARLAAAQQSKFARDFSQVVGVLMRDAGYKNLRIADLEWLIIPPLLAGQGRVAVSRLRNDGPIVPVAVALWARVSPSVDKRLMETLDKAPVLRANEWSSGDIIWLITLAGPKQALAGFLPELQSTVFKGKTVKIRAQTKDGKTVVRSLGPPPPAAG